MSIKVNVYNQQAEIVGARELADKVFNVKVNQDLVHQAVITQQANERKVLADTKTRAEVRGGGKKPWKQKGTGRARAGTIRSPLWIGGGVVFGPTSARNFKMKINKKMKQKAMFMALSDKVKSENFFLLDKIAIEEYKTKIFNEMLKALMKTKSTTDEAKKKSEKKSVLVILDKREEKIIASGRNLAGVEIINLDNINIVDLLKYKNLILTDEAVKKLEERYAR